MAYTCNCLTRSRLHPSFDASTGQSTSTGLYTFKCCHNNAWPIALHAGSAFDHSGIRCFCEPMLVYTTREQGCTNGGVAGLVNPQSTQQQLPVHQQQLQHQPSHPPLPLQRQLHPHQQQPQQLRQFHQPFDNVQLSDFSTFQQQPHVLGQLQQVVAPSNLSPIRCVLQDARSIVPQGNVVNCTVGREVFQLGPSLASSPLISAPPLATATSEQQPRFASSYGQTGGQLPTSPSASATVVSNASGQMRVTRSTQTEETDELTIESDTEQLARSQSVPPVITPANAKSVARPRAVARPKAPLRQLLPRPTLASASPPVQPPPSPPRVASRSVGQQPATLAPAERSVSSSVSIPIVTSSPLLPPPPLPPYCRPNWNTTLSTASPILRVPNIPEVILSSAAPDSGSGMKLGADVDFLSTKRAVNKKNYSRLPAQCQNDRSHALTSLGSSYKQLGSSDPASLFVTAIPSCKSPQARTKGVVAGAEDLIVRHTNGGVVGSRNFKVASNVGCKPNSNESGVAHLNGTSCPGGESPFSKWSPQNVVKSNNFLPVKVLETKGAVLRTSPAPALRTYVSKLSNNASVASDILNAQLPATKQEQLSDKSAADSPTALAVAVDVSTPKKTLKSEETPTAGCADASKIVKLSNVLPAVPVVPVTAETQSLSSFAIQKLAGTSSTVVTSTVVSQALIESTAPSSVSSNEFHSETTDESFSTTPDEGCGHVERSLNSADFTSTNIQPVDTPPKPDHQDTILTEIVGEFGDQSTTEECSSPSPSLSESQSAATAPDETESPTTDGCLSPSSSSTDSQTNRQLATADCYVILKPIHQSRLVGPILVSDDSDLCAPPSGRTSRETNDASVSVSDPTSSNPLSLEGVGGPPQPVVSSESVESQHPTADSVGSTTVVRVDGKKKLVRFESPPRRRSPRCGARVINGDEEDADTEEAMMNDFEAEKIVAPTGDPPIPPRKPSSESDAQPLSAVVSESSAVRRTSRRHAASPTAAGCAPEDVGTVKTSLRNKRAASPSDAPDRTLSDKRVAGRGRRGRGRGRPRVIRGPESREGPGSVVPTLYKSVPSAGDETIKMRMENLDRRWNLAVP